MMKRTSFLGVSSRRSCRSSQNQGLDTWCYKSSNTVFNLVSEIHEDFPREMITEILWKDNRELYKIEENLGQSFPSD